jgi:hypothetical protein
MVDIQDTLQITQVNPRIKYLLGVDKNNNVSFKSFHRSP